MMGDRPQEPTPEERTEAVLRARARKLAAEPEQAETATAPIEVIAFTVAGERYGIESTYVREVFRLRHLTPLPCTPAFIGGLTSLRGELVSVVDLQQLLELPVTRQADHTHVVLLKSAEMLFGILADSVFEAYTIPTPALQASLPTLSGIRDKYLRGVTEDGLAVLDAATLLTDPAMIVHEDVS
jgi:purine-binding chemotaxis protein CheW